MVRDVGGSAIDDAGAMAPDAGGARTAVRGLPSGAGMAGLVERARRGDEPAFEALVAPRIEPSFRRAFAILGNDSDARDAIQDALLDAWQGIHALRQADRFDAWLGRIVLNACRAVGRRRGRSRVREIQLDVVDDALPAECSAEGGLENQDAGLDELERAFERLPVSQRAILVLHHLEHRSVGEIAAALGIPAGTVMWRLHRARTALAHALEEERR